MRTFVLGLLALAATNPSRAGATDKAEGPAAPGETKRVRWASAPPAERGTNRVRRMKDNPTIDADWDKAAWAGVPPVTVDCNVYPPAIGIGATAALIGSMMANAENSAVASVRSRISASRSPSAEILRICSSVIV